MKPTFARSTTLTGSTAPKDVRKSEGEKSPRSVWTKSPLMDVTSKYTPALSCTPSNEMAITDVFAGGRMRHSHAVTHCVASHTSTIVVGPGERAVMVYAHTRRGWCGGAAKLSLSEVSRAVALWRRYWATAGEVCVCQYIRVRASVSEATTQFNPKLPAPTPHTQTHTQTHSLTHSLTHSFTHYLLTYLLTHSLTYLITYSLTHLLTHSLTHLLTYSLTHSLALGSFGKLLGSSREAVGCSQGALSRKFLGSSQKN